MDKWIKQNRITTSIIIVLVVALGFVYFNKQITKNVSDIDFQTKCATQAKSFFEYLVPEPKGLNLGDANTEYTNHYNSKLNKCFILITHPQESYYGDVYTKYLYDAVEKVKYGSFEWEMLTPGTEEYKSSVEGGKLLSCVISPDGNLDNNKNCSKGDLFNTSQWEFDKLVKVYMEN